MGAQFLVVGIGQLVIDDLGEDIVLAGQRRQLVEFLKAQDGGLFDEHVLAGCSAIRAASKWRSSGVATQTASTPWAAVADRVRPGEVGERGELGQACDTFAAAAGAAGDGGQLHGDQAEVAAEAALDLYRTGANVTMVHRRSELGSTIKYWVRPDIENRIKAGQIHMLFNTEVKRFSARARRGLQSRRRKNSAG